MAFHRCCKAIIPNKRAAGSGGSGGGRAAAPAGCLLLAPPLRLLWCAARVLQKRQEGGEGHEREPEAEPKGSGP